MNIYELYKNLFKSNNSKDISETIENLDKNILCDLIKMLVSKINLDYQMSIISNLVNEKTIQNNMQIVFMEHSIERLNCNSSNFNGNVPNVGDSIYIEQNNKFHLYKVKNRSFSMSENKQKIKCVINLESFPNAVIEEKHRI